MLLKHPRSYRTPTPHKRHTHYAQLFWHASNDVPPWLYCAGAHTFSPYISWQLNFEGKAGKHRTSPGERERKTQRDTERHRERTARTKRMEQIRKRSVDGVQYPLMRPLLTRIHLQPLHHEFGNVAGDDVRGVDVVTVLVHDHTDAPLQQWKVPAVTHVPVRVATVAVVREWHVVGRWSVENGGNRKNGKRTING